MVNHASQIERLTTGPVLQTRAGTRARLALLSIDELTILCRHLARDIGGLEERLWTGKRKRKRKPAAPIPETEKRQLPLLEV
jgi:hypothetical protein